VEPKTIVILITFLFIATISVFGFEYRGETADTTNQREVQIGISAGYVFKPLITEVHGKHGTFMGQSIDATVEGIDIEQNWGIGINTRYYLTNNFGIELDLLYSNGEFPEQEVTLQGYTISQPASDLNFFTISVGPGYRYKGGGMWQRVNPYASLSFTALIGFASDVNLTPYGKGGYSAVTGIGFNLHCGAQYVLSNIILSIEYRFEYLSSKVDYFRSFTEGLNFIKNTSYILLGTDYSF